MKLKTREKTTIHPLKETEIVAVPIAPIKPKRKRTTIADVLNKAADALVRRGWIQHEEGNDAGKMCMLGALNFAVTGKPYLHEDSLLIRGAEKKIDQVLISMLGREKYENEYSDSFVDWNDAGNRTKREVVAVLRKAAKLAAR